jgi:TolB-like protein/Flp pilus assembly protein TadD
VIPRHIAVSLAALALARPLPAQCPDGTPPPCARAARTAAPAPNSVAVLYFENGSPDSADAYLADGLTEEVILRLQQVRRLEVKSRYESRRVRGRHSWAPAELGRDLAVRYLVAGTIQRAGERIVVRVELSRADRGVGVWSQRFDQTSANVLDVIDEVARSVATGVAGQLLPAEAADLARRPTADAAAYEHFLRGNFYLAQRNAASLARAADEYEQANVLDPRFAASLARVAYAYALGVFYGVGTLPADTVQVRASRAVERAVRDGPGASDTWLAKGWLLTIRSYLGAGDYVDEAIAALARAVQLDPGNAEAHHQYAQGLILVSRDSAARSEYRRALELEPGRAITYEELALVAVMEGRLLEARDLCDSVLAADPRMLRGYVVRSRILLGLGDIAGAQRDVASALALAPGDQAARDAHAMLLAATGDTAAAVREVGPGINTQLGPEPLLFVGQVDRALAAIEALQAPSIRCSMLRYPSAVRLRGQPRYDRLVAGCPEIAKAR